MPPARIFDPDRKPTPPVSNVLSWFAQFVIDLDAGRLSEAQDAREQLAQLGFNVTYRRRPKPNRGVMNGR
jgi:hypothetical protein